MKQNVGAPVGMGTWGHVNAIFGCHLNPIPAKKTDYANQILIIIIIFHSQDLLSRDILLMFPIYR